MPDKYLASLERHMPIWQFMLAYRPRAEEQNFRRCYLNADVKQILMLTLTVVAMMGVMTLADIPRMAEIAGLSLGIELRISLLLTGLVLFWAVRRWRSARTIDIGTASYALLAAICIVIFHNFADVSAARIGTVGTLFIFAANIAFPVYGLYLVPAVLVLLAGETVVLFNTPTVEMTQHRHLILIIFVFAEIMSLSASAHLQRTRYLAFHALSEVKTLSGMIPICSNCNKIRDDSGYYQQLEEYISAHSNAEFSHGVCPDCINTLYPEFKNPKRFPEDF